LGSNARAALITRALAEMNRLGLAMGARSETLMGLSGCGDVILTCTDDQSRNRRLGLALAQGMSENEAQSRIGQAVEAIHNVQTVYQLSIKHQIDMPITRQVSRLLGHQISPQEAVNELFARSLKEE
jgi:glycerol-3-phosphate dehydrogenase (NAD(P)+)